MANDVAQAFWKGSNAQAFGSRLATDPAYRRLNESELSEVFAVLPNLQNLRILELGAGIGRFTELLARDAQHVDALDICEEAIATNRTRTGARANVRHLVADVTDYDLGVQQYDLVFCNWLLMYLDDAGVRSLLTRCAAALKPNGKLFVRESCEKNYAGHALIAETLLGLLPPFGRQTFNLWKFKIPSLRKLLWFARRSSSLQKYRDSREYGSWFSEHFEVTRSGYLETYARHFNNPHQRYWLLTVRGAA